LNYTQRDDCVRKTYLLAGLLGGIFKMPRAFPQPLTFYTDKEIKVYPELADSVVAQAPAASPITEYGDWGSWVEVVPANGITEDFLLLAVFADVRRVPTGPSFPLRWQVQLGKGDPGAETPIFTARGIISGGDTSGQRPSTEVFPLSVPQYVPANTRIVARACHQINSPQNYGVKILYVELPLVSEA